MFPIHKNETGSFQELAHKEDIDFGQLSILSIKPGCVRGKHYHTRKIEWFCCIKGQCVIDLFNIKTKKEKRVFLNGSRREFVKVEPFEVHTLWTLFSDPDCEVLIIISEEFDEKDPDTFKYEGEI